MFVVHETENSNNRLEFKPLKLSNPPYIMSFYRSEKHASGKHGVQDTKYNGNFGFDCFNEEIMAREWIKNYEKLSGKDEIKRGINNFKDDGKEPNFDYLCPYLSIWPPNVDGNKDTKNPKHKVVIYLKLEKSSEYKAEKSKLVNIKLTSSSEEIKIKNDSQKDDFVKEFNKTFETPNNKNKSKIYSITVECLKPFEKEVYIDAYSYHENEDKKHLIGRLIIYPNAIRYHTTIQPIWVKSKNPKKTLNKRKKKILFN